ncbi:MAG TPA: DUF1206 domain-containing protein, partial [Acidimicrobiales bacterium]|nr:DUF1206 domain-containing protein [Acidimicrobiales bacterium]
GLAGRTVFYLVVTVLTARIAALGGGSSPQDNAHGALQIISSSLIGKIGIGVVAVGFALFGLGRLVGSFRAGDVGKGRRAQTALQGLFYCVLAYIPASFLAGNHAAGSEQEQHKTAAELLGFPGGRELVVAIGVVVLVVCASQIRTAVSRNFEDGMELGKAPAVVRRLVKVAGQVGIASRAMVFVPIGVFFMVSGVDRSPKQAKGLDGELLALSGHWWGVALLALVACGLGVFVVYSGLEARYRQVVAPA